MAKKVKGREKKSDPLEGISETAQQVWAAGVAAFEQAQKQGGKLLATLLEEGERIQSRTRKVAVEKAGGVRHATAETRDKLEGIFDQRVAQAMERIGVPGRVQLEQLTQRISTLEQELRRLREGPAPDDVGDEAVPAAVQGEADDLERIKGLGPALERKLNAHGINTYRQIVSLSPEEIEELERSVLRSSGRFERDDWVAQARRLHAERYGEDL